MIQEVEALLRLAQTELPPPSDALASTIRVLSDSSDEKDIVDEFPRESFPGTMARLLTKKAHGVGASHMNTRLFTQFNLVASYYPYNSDLKLLKKHGKEYGELVRQDLPESMRILLFELGSGKESPKTRAILKHVRPDDYAVDEGDLGALMATVEMVGNEFPGMGIYPRNKDFNKDNMEAGEVPVRVEINEYDEKQYFFSRQEKNLPKDARRLIVQFGTTLGNMEGDPNGALPVREVLGALQNYRAHLSDGDYAIISLDQNQNKASLNKCYGDPVHRQLAEDLLQRTQAQIPHKGFDANNFKYTRFWNPQNHLYANGYEVARDNSFEICGLKAEWKKGEILSYANSYKYPTEFLEIIFAATGFEIVQVNPDDEGRMHHYVLRAAPFAPMKFKPLIRHNNFV